MNTHFSALVSAVMAAGYDTDLAAIEIPFTRELLLAARHGLDSRLGAFTREGDVHTLVARGALYSHPCEAQVRAAVALPDLAAEKARVAGYVAAVGELFADLERLAKPGVPAAWLRHSVNDAMASVAGAWQTELALASEAAR